MYKSFYQILMLVLCGMTLLSAQTKTRKVTISGKVVDSKTNFVISNVAVILSPSDMQVAPDVDTVYTGKSGTFSTVMEVKKSVESILYVAMKSGYSTKSGSGKIVASSTDPTSYYCDLDTIALSPEENIKVLVKGTVLESGINVVPVPIVEAMVLLHKKGLGVFPPKYDTVFTEKDGTFSTHIIMNNSSGIIPEKLMVAYIVSKKGYGNKNGAGPVKEGVADLGEILLDELSVSINHVPSIKISQITPNRIAIYSIKGQILYEGPEINIAILQANGVLNNQTLIITSKLNNKIIHTKKVVF